MRKDPNIDPSHRALKLRYKGRISFDLVDSMLFLLLKQLETVEEDINTRKKVYSVLMECSQNLCLHADGRERTDAYDAGRVLISLNNKNGEYKISTGNFISNDKVDDFKSLLDEINDNNTADGLKKLYNKKLTNNTYTSKGGGGLGLIDIARKSNEKLHYTFEEIDDTYSFFKLKVRIKKKVVA